MLKNIYGNVDVMTKALNASWKRNEIIANNAANVNTPNFKRLDVQFEDILKDFIKGNRIAGTITHQKHIPIGVRNIHDLDYKIVQDKRYSTRRDGNNVDIDVETAEFAKNNITYNTLVTQLNNSLQRLKIAINEGKR